MKWTLFLQTRLLKDTVQSARCQIVAWFSRNRDTTRLTGVLELAMTASRGHQIPTVLTKHAQYVRYFHCRSRIRKPFTQPNDEVERRGAALPINETDLSRSSTCSLSH